MAEVSIIIPVYNVEKYLYRCVNSVINQTLKDIEIILVDDGSTDNSGKLCDELSLVDSRIKVVHKTNGGLSSARNEGIKNATASFLGFVDSDDWISTDMYEYMMHLQKRTNADVVSCSYMFTTEEGQFIKQPRLIENVMDSVTAIKYYLSVGIREKVNDYPAWSKLYRRNVFENILFPEGLLFEDMATNFAIIQNVNIYVKSNRICYYYYQNLSSITRNRYSLKHNDLIKVTQQIIDLSQNADEQTKKLGLELQAKAYLSLLAKIVKYGKEEDVSIESMFLLNTHLSNRINHVLSSPLPFSKKCIAIILAYLFKPIIKIRKIK